MRPMSMVRILASTTLFGGGLLGQDGSVATRLTSDAAQEGFPSWRPDGKSFIYSRFSWTDSLGKNGIWRFFVEDGQLRQVSSGIAERPRLSPDGRCIVFDSDTGSSMSMVDSEGGGPRKFLPDSIGIQNGGLPCWSPDGSHIAFKEGTTGSLCIYDAKTGAVARIFHEEGLLPLPGCWSGDGTYILVALMNRQTRKSTMMKISRDGKEKQQITGHRDGFHRYLALSPDGRRMVFSSTRAGGHDIWIMDVDPEQLKEELRALSR